MSMPRWFGLNAVYPAKVIAMVLLVCCALDLGVGGSGLLWAQKTAPDHHSWKFYANVRFNYGVCYPEDLLVPQGEAPNGDGQKFLAKDGANLVVYGQNNALNEPLKDALEDTASRLAGKSGKVTYKVIKPTWFVVSGQNGQKVFYAKTLYSHEQFKSFELVYDSSASAIYEPVVRRLNTCFTNLGH